MRTHFHRWCCIYRVYDTGSASTPFNDKARAGINVCVCTSVHMILYLRLPPSKKYLKAHFFFCEKRLKKIHKSSRGPCMILLCGNITFCCCCVCCVRVCLCVSVCSFNTCACAHMHKHENNTHLYFDRWLACVSYEEEATCILLLI